ncbi:MAG: hypothetical protein WC676_06370 [Candidatus Omnitrophota bacterium]
MNLKTKKSLTLAELLTATVVTGLIMAAVASMDFAIRQSGQGTTRNAIVTMRTTATMADIIKNASLAIGNGTTLPSTGIDPTASHFCIRQDAGPPPGTPGNYNDDRWVCYTLPAASTTLYKCIDDIPPIDPFDCGPAVPGNEIIGSVDVFDYSLQQDPVLMENYIEITLKSRMDPTQPASVTNPEYTLTSRVRPDSHSF